jgi:hypothetical protein
MQQQDSHRQIITCCSEFRVCGRMDPVPDWYGLALSLTACSCNKHALRQLTLMTEQTRVTSNQL